MKKIGSSYYPGFTIWILRLFAFSALILYACDDPVGQFGNSNQGKSFGTQFDPAPGPAPGELNPLTVRDKRNVKFEDFGDTSEYGTIEKSVLTIKETVKSIKDGSLKSFPSQTPRYIIRGAFAGKGITKIIFPTKPRMTHIGKFAFAGNKLTNVTIPNSIKVIEQGAFLWNKLTQIKLSDSLESIGQFAFLSNNLKSVVIPKSVKSIGKHAFLNNDALKTITISPELLNRIDREQIFPMGVQFLDHHGNPIPIK